MVDKNVVPPHFEIKGVWYFLFHYLFNSVDFRIDKPLMLTGQGKQKHIVLADDDSDDRELFVEAISEIDAAATVLTVEDGDKLMTALKGLSNPPDIIFLDVNMPRKSGKECIADIKRDKRLTDVPIVIYSTTLNKKDIDDAWTNGALCFMRKPDSYSKLKSILREIVTTDFQRAERERTEKILYNL
jgi:CheY-like chemotaxis protein